MKMKNKLKDYTEPNITIRKIEIISLILLLIGSLLSYISGISKLNKDPGELKYLGTVTMMRDFESEDYDEDSSSVEVIFENEDGQLIKTYTYEEYEELQDEEITAYAYETDEGTKLFRSWYWRRSSPYCSRKKARTGSTASGSCCCTCWIPS